MAHLLQLRMVHPLDHNSGMPTSLLRDSRVDTRMGDMQLDRFTDERNKLLFMLRRLTVFVTKERLIHYHG
jgi:hypothetical protein